MCLRQKRSGRRQAARLAPPGDSELPTAWTKSQRLTTSQPGRVCRQETKTAPPVETPLKGVYIDGVPGLFIVGTEIPVACFITLIAAVLRVILDVRCRALSKLSTTFCYQYREKHSAFVCQCVSSLHSDRTCAK